jgi:hypothetical protein
VGAADSGASEDAQIRASRTWFPPAYEAAAKERERELADERARRLAVAGGQPSTRAFPEPVATAEAATVSEPAKTVPEPAATAETSILPEANPPVHQPSGSGWLPGEQAAPPSPLGQAAPPSPSGQAAPPSPSGQAAPPSPSGPAAPPQFEADQATSPWLPTSERPDEGTEPDSPWLPAPKRAIAEPVAQTASAATITQPVHANAPPGATVLTAASRRAISAVEAYCRELCPPEEASAAAAEVLGSFTAGDELDLLRHTREVSAKHAVQPGSRRGWWLPRGARDQECESIPGLLAARANGELDHGAQAALERHLDSCATCQAAEIRARRADRAFAGITRIELPADEPHPRSPPSPRPRPPQHPR